MGDQQTLVFWGVTGLVHAQVCTRPDIAYFVGVLGRYLSNPSIDH